MRQSPIRFLFLLALPAIAALYPAAISAQTPGSIRGQVTDPSAAVVPGATVAITGSNVSRSVKSDNQGRYSIPNVPAGSYNLRADAPGFVTFVQQGVNVSGGQASPLDIALQIAAEASQVSVVDQAQTSLSVDASSNVGALVLKEADLDALPDDPDDLQADLEALAGPAAGPNGAQFFIDGFSGGQLPPKSSIREIRINSNPFSAEYDRPGFGRVEILTRPGTDNYHGQAFFNYGNRDFDSRNPLLQSAAPAYGLKMFEGNLGGPINKKSSFNLEFQRRDITENALINALALDSNFNKTPFNEAVLTPNHLWQVNPRVDYAINQNNTLVLRYTHSDNSQIGGVGNFNLPTQETQTHSKTNMVQITETAVLGTKAVDETAFQFRRNNLNQTGVGDSTIPGLDVSASFNSGGSPYTSNFTDSIGYELRNFVTIAEGKHAIKIGFRVRQTNEDTQSTSNFNGSYIFSAPNGNASVPQCLANAGLTAAPTSLDIYRQTQLLLTQGVSMASILAQGCGPSEFTLNQGIAYQAVRQFDLGGYIQDDWRLLSNLTVNVGLRYETQNNIHDHADFAPRLGFAWAPGVKGNTPSKTVIRGGYGFFYDRFDESNTINTLRYDGSAQQSYLITPSSAGAAAALAYYPLLPPIGLLQQQNQLIYRVDPNFRAPYMMQSAIGVDRQLPARTQMSVNFINTRGDHVLRTRDINAPLPGTYTGIGTGVRPFPGGDIYQYESSGIFKQTQVIVNVNSRINSHFQLQGNYVLGFAHTNAATMPMDQYNDDEDWGRAPYDIRHRGVITGNLGLPFKIVASPFLTASSGAPFNITTGQAFDGDGVFNARPAFGTCPTSGTLPANLKRTAFGCFNTNPAPGTPLIPYDYGQGPAQFSVNIRISRTWGWGERKGAAPTPGQGGGGRGGPGGGGPGGGGRGGGGGGFRGGGFAGGGRGGGFGAVGNTGKRYNLTLTASARNLFNHVNYAPPNGSLTSPFFGESLSLAQSQGGGPFGGGNGAAGNRKIELQLRFQF
jgi:hypothetical protein